MKKPWILASLLAFGALGGLWAWRHRPQPPSALVDSQATLAAWVAAPQKPVPAEAFQQVLQALVGDYRRIIVLFADEKKMALSERQAAEAIGTGLYYRNQERQHLLERALTALMTGNHSNRLGLLDTLVTHVESGPGLFDADRLVFRELLKQLQQALAGSSDLPAIKLAKRVGEDLAALAEIEGLYDKELKHVFSRFDTRAIAITRQRWDDYVAKLTALHTREQILRDFGTILPYQNRTVDEGRELTGRSLPPKTLMLTFDDGPHGTYTEEIAAILTQYGIPGVFFELGQNLGQVDAQGKAQPGRLAPTSRRLQAAGHLLANHSFSHANLSKADAAAMESEVQRTEALLQAVGATPSGLFRFPYGAGSEASLAVLDRHRLKSMFWNIDSRDWADPIPNAIADRVLKAVDAEQRGIVLFHDIHERTVKALPTILERLAAEGYRFAGWEKGAFKIGEATVPAGRSAPTTGYRDSWAVVVGVDAYEAWPKLQHAARDAMAVRDSLVQRFGFASDKVFLLTNQEAKRAAILNLFHQRLSQIQRDDRVFFFFAGHGATRKLSSGRDLGYLVPVDSRPDSIATDGIPMTELQNLAESLPSKHVFFVMDACYSGLGLVRGGAPNFLKENARRLGRQMLTAGGADQMVADGGPNGHSLFTWTLLQGLEGKADLNGDGYITATELAAYVAPSVAALSPQTPAFGSLPGSEGGEFVFELPSSQEALGPEAPQLNREALAVNQKINANLEALKLQTPTHVTATTAPAKIAVKGLDGGEITLTPGKSVPLAPRQAAQRANDRGLEAFREQRYAGAEALFAEALKLRPDFALAANNLGYVYFKQGKHAEAIRWYENTLKLEPGRAIARLNLGQAQAAAGQREPARKSLETYLALNAKGKGADFARDLLRSL